MPKQNRGEVWLDAQSLVTVSEAKFLRKLGNLQPEQLFVVEDAVRQWLKL